MCLGVDTAVLKGLSIQGVGGGGKGRGAQERGDMPGRVGDGDQAETTEVEPGTAPRETRRAEHREGGKCIFRTS